MVIFDISNNQLIIAFILVQQLNDRLKSYPERQTDRNCLALGPYSLNLSGNFGRKLSQMYPATARQSSCLHGLSSIAGTPIVMARPMRLSQQKFDAKLLAVKELNRNLSVWQTESIDIDAKLQIQWSALLQYADKVLMQAPAKAQFAKMDVFNRLYQQTPARYKVNAKMHPQSSKATATGRPISTSKVTMLKRLFTPEENQPTVLNKAVRKPLVQSNKIKSLCRQLTERNPDFADKMNKSVKPNSAITDKSTSQVGASKFPQIKRQLFK